MPGKQHAASCIHMRTLVRVSGRRSPTSPPPTSTDDASRMGMALVMPTSEPKIRLPSTAASLHMALQKPKPVPLKTEKTENISGRTQYNHMKTQTDVSCGYLHSRYIVTTKINTVIKTSVASPTLNGWLCLTR